MQERADELDLDSSSTTVFTSRAHWRWMNTSTARQECATLFVHYVQNCREIPHRCCCLLAAKIPRL